MRRTLYARVGLLVLLLTTQSNSLFAQKIELNPCYGSFFRPAVCRARGVRE